MEQTIRELLEVVKTKLDSYDLNAKMILHDVKEVKEALSTTNMRFDTVGSQVIEARKDIGYLKESLDKTSIENKQEIDLLWKNFRECKKECNLAMTEKIDSRVDNKTKSLEVKGLVAVITGGAALAGYLVSLVMEVLKK